MFSLQDNWREVFIGDANFHPYHYVIGNYSNIYFVQLYTHTQHIVIKKLNGCILMANLDIKSASWLLQV